MKFVALLHGRSTLVAPLSRMRTGHCLHLIGVVGPDEA
jgi:hypothetical protein